MRNSIVLRRAKSKATHLLQMAMAKRGVGITSLANLISLKERAKAYEDLAFIQAFPASSHEAMLMLLSKSKSQLRQDLFVLSEVDYKKGGYFVEFGASDGITLSNSYLLESEFYWTGILSEPAKVWHKELYSNRPSASIEPLCVWKDSSSSLVFNETFAAELSTLDSFSAKDSHKTSRELGKKYKVQTISLNDLLRKYEAPKKIDYLSIDTEGSEFEILNAFDFDQYQIQIITVEHNFTPQRELIFDLLTSHGFVRKYETVSQFDDWYVKE